METMQNILELSRCLRPINDQITIAATVAFVVAKAYIRSHRAG